jgi:conjugative relaxase-like TrwC/TraI family protein
MMTMSRAISAGQALDYYKQEFTNSKDNYYSESGDVKGQWYGRLADEWNLKGEVLSDQYVRLVVGQDPHTGEQLIKSVKAREIVDEFGKKTITSEHRAGWDATISAPKSVSLAALVGDDERIRDAHRESVNEALKEFEEYLQARGGGDKPAMTTGKMVAAQFEHTSSRPDRENGYAAPQLHTHVVIFNMTHTEDGKVRSVQPSELYDSQKYATAIYRAKLADKLQELGYEIRVDPRTGAPEIKGFSAEYLQESSPRRREVVKDTELAKERLEREGKTVSDNARLKQAVARNNRRSKNFDPTLMRDRALEMDAKHDSQASHLVTQARERGPLRLAQNEIATRAQEAVTFARDNAVERKAVADLREVRIDALRRNLGRTTYEAVASEFSRRQERGEFLNITRDHRTPAITTERMVEMEKENIQTVIDGKGTAPAIVRAARVKDVVAETAQSQQRRLNVNQRSAIETILSRDDQIVGLQGGAGTGKTTALSVLRAAAEKGGYQVRGFAPTTRAARQLGESGIATETLQKFLCRRQETKTEKRLFVLDESSLASTRQIHQFFARLNASTDKVLLVGDVRQHQAIDAGSPFEQLQKHGMTTAKLSAIVRQRNKELKETVTDLSFRRIKEAVTALESRGKVIEITDERDRLQAMAKDYATNPSRTLVISPANRERAQLNSLIHHELQRDGAVSRDDHQMKIYVARNDMTGTERGFANAYRPDDVIHYNRNSKVYKVRAGDYAKVIDTNHEKNEITVRFADGRTVNYNPTRLSGVNVYTEAERLFAEGDRLQFRAPFAEKRVVNGELGTITKIDPNEIHVGLDSGHEITFDPQRFRHVDHGYAVTSHSSQGLTVDRVLLNADTQESVRLLNDRLAYVALSRARDEALIYTDSVPSLRETLSRAADKEMALEAARDNSREKQQERDDLTNDPLAPHTLPRPEHDLDQNTTHIEATQAEAAELAVESEETELAAALLL